MQIAHEVIGKIDFSKPRFLNILFTAFAVEGIQLRSTSFKTTIFIAVNDTATKREWNDEQKPSVTEEELHLGRTAPLSL